MKENNENTASPVWKGTNINNDDWPLASVITSVVNWSVSFQRSHS